MTLFCKGREEGAEPCSLNSLSLILLRFTVQLENNETVIVDSTKFQLKTHTQKRKREYSQLDDGPAAIRKCCRSSSSSEVDNGSDSDYEGNPDSFPKIVWTRAKAKQKIVNTCSFPLEDAPHEAEALDSRQEVFLVEDSIGEFCEELLAKW